MSKQRTFAPAFCSMFAPLSDLANEFGYALTVHGTLLRDFDLVAIPWAEDASDPDKLVTAFAERLRLIYGEFGTGVSEPEAKPHGRIAWSLFIGNGSQLDLSVMPRSPHA